MKSKINSAAWAVSVVIIIAGVVDVTFLLWYSHFAEGKQLGKFKELYEQLDYIVNYLFAGLMFSSVVAMISDR